jgi:hypothetical protein
VATLRYHAEVVDGSNKLLPWYTSGNAYDYFLDTLWTYLPTVPNYNGVPMYYLTCGSLGSGDSPILPQVWENDWGERVPNFVEFARLYYAYCGGTGPITIAKALLDYALAHGMSSAGANWPNMAYGTANSGETTIDGNNVAWTTQYSLLVDLAADMGMAFYRMYQYDGTAAYRTAAINCGDVLASKIAAGSATVSPWRYVVNASTGGTVSGGDYCSNWAGAMTLFDLLIEAGEPNAAAYTTARTTLRTWILTYPMSNNRWVSGHSDNNISGYSNWCHTTATNMALYFLDNAATDPNFAAHIDSILAWCESTCVAGGGYSDSTYSGTSGVYLGAHVPVEQNVYTYRMGYQAARLGAVYARRYLTSGNATHKDIAYRNLNYNTYMMDNSGMCADGPTTTVGYWWGDCWAEGPRMYFHGMAGMPEYAPAGENHILYSRATLKNVTLTTGNVQYTPANSAGIEYLRLAFQPSDVTVGGVAISLRADLTAEGYTVQSLGSGDYAVALNRARSGVVSVSTGGSPPVGTPVLSVR